jgi:transcriptional regulator with XRE-family HTH domain
MQDTTVLKVKDPDALRLAIAAANRTQTDVAKEVGISRARLAQLVGGHPSSSTPVPTALAIAAAVDRDATDLFVFPDGENLQRLGFIE